MKRKNNSLTIIAICTLSPLIVVFLVWMVITKMPFYDSYTEKDSDKYTITTKTVNKQIMEIVYETNGDAKRPPRRLERAPNGFWRVRTQHGYDKPDGVDNELIKSFVDS